MSTLLKGDFIGFTFNDIHSSVLGVVRVSDGSRYNEDLLPSFSDRTLDVTGRDGIYYFGSSYKQREFEVSYAFDNITESNLRDIKLFLSDKKIHELIFDEVPYKVYKAKISGTPTIKYICFMENGQRIYKGEGTFYFVCYYPFATVRYNFLEQYTESNVNEWAEASGLLPDETVTNAFSVSTSGSTFSQYVYNPGDFECDFNFYVNFNDEEVIPAFDLQFLKNSSILDQVSFSEIQKLSSEDTGIKINTKINLIEGFKEDDGKKIITGTVYDQFKAGGELFRIPPMKKSDLTTSDVTGETYWTTPFLIRTVTKNSNVVSGTLEYSFIYV